MTSTERTANPAVDARRKAQLEARLAKARARRQTSASPAEQAIGVRPAGTTPLSSAQRRLWFLAELEPDSAAYGIPVGFTLRGALEVEALQQAWSVVVGRHEVLRTRYTSADGEPVAVLDPAPDRQIAVIHDVIDSDAAVAELTEQPFDLAAEQPWRAALLRLGPDVHVLVVVLHHIAADGWSIKILLDDLAAAYSGAPLPDLAIQYADVAHHRSTQAASDEQDLAYWRAQLAGAPGVLALPTDRPRPQVAPSTAGTLVEVLDTATVQAVRRAAAATSTTPYMVLLSALHIVLSRWADSRDVVVGTPVAGRTRLETETLIGCFVNTLALRTTADATMDVRGLLTVARDAMLGGLTHQAVGFDQVVDAVSPVRDVSTTPVFQVMLTLHSEPSPTLNLTGVSAEWLPLESGVAKVDLSVHVSGDLADDTGQSEPTTVEITYRSEFFAPDTVARLFGHLQQVLASMPDQLDSPVDEVPMLSPEEIAAVPVGAGVAAPSLPAPSVHALVRSVARSHPDAVAVSSRGVDLTYAQLQSRADQLARHLLALGVQPQDRVGLLLDRSTELVVGILGVLAAGAAYVPIDPVYPDQRVAAMLTQAGASVVVTQREVAPRVPESLGRVVLDDPADPLGGASCDPIADRTAPDHLAYVLFTSGSTGTPKGVAVEHRHLLSYLAAATDALQIKPGWSWAMMSTPSADLGLTNLLGALSTGGRVHFLTYEQVTDPAAVAAYFAEHRIDAMKLVPSHLQALWDEANPTAVLPRELLVLAGEPLPWSLVDQIESVAPGLAVHNNYGPSETTVSTIGTPIAALDAEARLRSATVPLGRPFPGTRAHVLDSLGRAVPVGVPGELYLAGPQVARGYLGPRELTTTRFVAEPGGEGVAYRTGDVVRRSPSGQIEFVGRADDQVKIRGFRVEPDEIAKAAREHELVADCVVIAREDRPGQRRLVAYLVPVDGVELPLEQIRESMRQVLPDYMVPAAWVPMSELPLNANGKIDRAALPVPDDRQRLSAHGPVEPATDTERRLAAAWREVLGLETVGAEDNFFDIGGDSFSAVRAVRAIGEVSVVQLFTHPTVRELAAIIDGNGPGAATGLLRRLGPVKTADVHLVCVPYGGGSPITFAPLADQLGAGIDLHAVDLPGHDPSRPDEVPVPVVEVAAALVPEIQALGGEVVLYGHCLGGALAVETALALEAAGTTVLGVVEAGTFPSARLPGRIAALMAKLLPSDRMLSDRAYHDMLRSLGGFTDVIDRADRDLLVRALRHDSREAEAYYTRRYAALEAGQEQPRLTAPVLCVVGDRDRATELYEERFAEWEDFADAVELTVIPKAGHYFLKHQAEELAAALADRIGLWRSGRRRRTPSVTADAGTPSAKTFLWVAITQMLSMIGTGLTSFALGIWVLQETGSVSDFALISVMAVAPAILVSPLSGAVADRFDRRRVMLIADGVAGLGTAVLVYLLATDQLSLWFIYLFAAVGSIANAFQRPAYLAAITQLVPKRYLGQANGLVTLGTNAGDLIAALLGGVLIGLTGLAGVVAVDVVTFLLGMAVLVAVRFPNKLFIRQEEGLVAEVIGGWRYIVRRRGLVAMVVFFVVFNFLFAIPVVAATPLILEGGTPQILGVVTAVGGAGAVAGAVLMALWGGTHRRAIGMVGGTIALGIAVIVLGATRSSVVQAIGLFGVYGALLVVNSHWLALIQTKVGLELQGRVLATNQMLAMSMMPLGFLSIGPLTGAAESWTGDGSALAGLGEVFGSGLNLLVVFTGVVLAIWGIAGLCFSPLRRMEDGLPDAVPDAVIEGDRDALQARADALVADPMTDIRIAERK